MNTGVGENAMIQNRVNKETRGTTAGVLVNISLMVH